MGIADRVTYPVRRRRSNPLELLAAVTAALLLVWFSPFHRAVNKPAPVSPTSEVSHQVHSSHSGVRAGVHPGRTVGNLADVPCGGSLASVFVVASRCSLHSPSRVGGLASRRDGLAWRQVTLFRGAAIPDRYVGIGRGSWLAVVVVAARAVVPRVPRVAARWRVVGRVGDRAGVRVAVTV